MNLIEGSKRMQQSGRAMVIIALAAFTLCVLCSGIFAFLPSEFHVDEVLRIVLPVLLLLVGVCGALLALGALLWIAGWIVEGFAHHTH